MLTPAIVQELLNILSEHKLDEGLQSVNGLISLVFKALESPLYRNTLNEELSHSHKSSALKYCTDDEFRKQTAHLPKSDFEIFQTHFKQIESTSEVSELDIFAIWNHLVGQLENEVKENETSHKVKTSRWLREPPSITSKRSRFFDFNPIRTTVSLFRIAQVQQRLFYIVGEFTGAQISFRRAALAYLNDRSETNIALITDAITALELRSNVYMHYLNYLNRNLRALKRSIPQRPHHYDPDDESLSARNRSLDLLVEFIDPINEIINSVKLLEPHFTQLCEDPTLSFFQRLILIFFPEIRKNMEKSKVKPNWDLAINKYLHEIQAKADQLETEIPVSTKIKVEDHLSPLYRALAQDIAQLNLPVEDSHLISKAIGKIADRTSAKEGEILAKAVIGHILKDHHGLAILVCNAYMKMLSAEIYSPGAQVFMESVFHVIDSVIFTEIGTPNTEVNKVTRQTYEKILDTYFDDWSSDTKHKTHFYKKIRFPNLAHSTNASTHDNLELSKEEVVYAQVLTLN